MRQQFLIPSVMVPGEITLVYSHVDRIIAGGIVPIKPLTLKAGEGNGRLVLPGAPGTGIINVGPQGTVTLDGETHVLDSTDGLYVGLGVKEVLFSSSDPKIPPGFISTAPLPTKNSPPPRSCARIFNRPRLVPWRSQNERKILQVHSSVGSENLPARDGNDRIGNRQHVEHHADPYP